MRRGLLPMILLLAAGCSTFRSPAVSLQEVAAAGATEEALALAIVMELRNSNAAPIELYEFRYTVSVDGRQVYAGRRAAGATLPGRSVRTVTLPAVVPFGAMDWRPGALPASARWSVTGHVRYNAPGQLAELLFDTGIRRPARGFENSGTVALGAGDAPGG